MPRSHYCRELLHQSPAKRPLEDPEIEDITPRKLIKKNLGSDLAHNARNSVRTEDTGNQTIDKDTRVKLEPGATGNAKNRENPHGEISADILKTTDEDVIANIRALSPEKVLGTLAQRSQQLMELRQSVCQLLGVLVPDLNLPDSQRRSLDDNTIDALLKDVLNANTDSANDQ